MLQYCLQKQQTKINEETSNYTIYMYRTYTHYTCNACAIHSTIENHINGRKKEIHRPMYKDSYQNKIKEIKG